MSIPYSQKELMSRGPQRTLTGSCLTEVSFPIGGIGTGMISLGGWGQLREWEIMNRPRKGYVPDHSFFMVKVSDRKHRARTKVLQGPSRGNLYAGGRSAKKACGEGLPHFRNASFTGSYPFANVELWEDGFPLRVRLEAFNPFIPLNDKDSSIPVAILQYHLRNISNRSLAVTVFGNLRNIIGDSDTAGRVCEARSDRRLKGLWCTTTKYAPDSHLFGSMALTTLAETVDVWPRWNHDNLDHFWAATALSDTFLPPGNAPIGTVAVKCRLRPGETATVPFFISWYFPNYDHGPKTQCECQGDRPAERVTWKNYYATVWSDAWDVANYTTIHFERLYSESKRFHDALFSSTLPRHVLDAVSSQMAILKTTTCLRLPDGTFYGFEGCRDGGGCCHGSCTHVWNYAQALPHLFPSLQRSMRTADYENNQLEDGFMEFRMPLPPGTKAKGDFHPCADGQMGCIMQVYREWLISGDDEWLHKLWPNVKKSLEFAWKYWDADKDGVMEGMQHNTYDIEFYGPNTMMGSLYVGALKAASLMAQHLGETEKAKEYADLVERGARWTDANLFNGEYYEQKVNPTAHLAWPEKYRQMAERHGRDDKFDWPRWQYGKGCISDQLLGQWYARMLGLGYLYDPSHVRKALKSIFKYNWKSDLTDVGCLYRLYALNDEAGLLIGTWPRGERPGFAFYFADEVWTGIEYQVASHLIYEGMVPEGLAIVKGARDRYTGEQRNPWNEIECGHYYSRAMSSYALLMALSGFSYSAPERRIEFAPRIFSNRFQVFFSVGSGWGRYCQRVAGAKAAVALQMDYGSLRLRALSCGIPFRKKRPTLHVTVNGKPQEGVSCHRQESKFLFQFDKEIPLAATDLLAIVLN